MTRTPLRLATTALLALLIHHPGMAAGTSSPAQVSHREWWEFTRDDPGHLVYSPQAWDLDEIPWLPDETGPGCLDYVGDGWMDVIPCHEIPPNWFFVTQGNTVSTAWVEGELQATNVYKLSWADNPWGYDGGPCLVGGRGHRTDWKYPASPGDASYHEIGYPGVEWAHCADWDRGAGWWRFDYDPNSSRRGTTSAWPWKAYQLVDVHVSSRHCLFVEQTRPGGRSAHGHHADILFMSAERLYPDLHGHLCTSWDGDNGGNRQRNRANYDDWRGNAWALADLPWDGAAGARRAGGQASFANEPRYVSDPAELQAGDRLYLRSTYIASGTGLEAAGAPVALRARNGTFHVGHDEGEPEPGSQFEPVDSATFLVREVMPAAEHDNLWRSLGLAEFPPAAVLRLGCWNGAVVARGAMLACSEANGEPALELLMFGSRPSSSAYTARLRELGTAGSTRGIAIVGRAPGGSDWSTYGVLGTVAVDGATVTVDGQIVAQPGVQDDRPSNQFNVWKLGAE